MKRTDFCRDWTFSILGGEKHPVTLPHDAMLHQPRTPDAPSGGAQAFFPGGAYVYEKTFALTAEQAARHTFLEFEGVYKNARVFVNGQEAGGYAYGYLPFFVCCDGMLKEGENTLRVECENKDQPDSRWYSGAGIYRPVWLWTGPQGGIPPQGIKVTTVSLDPPTVQVAVEAGEGDLSVEILDGENLLAKGQGTQVELALPGATLWSEDTPQLYTCRATLSREGEPVDTAEITFGLRQIAWDNQGLYINGKSVLLRGGCLHHDSGVLGSATYDESEFRRVKRLKEAGFNAIRSAHNPASRALVEACDRLGVYLMDEAWDMWFHHKNKFDYAGQWEEHYRADLEAVVSRDYNHPSVILYSIGNEVSEPAKGEGLEKEREMVELLHQLDSTRPVTGGFNLMILANAAKGKGVYKEDGGMADDTSQKMQGMNSTMFNLIASVVGTGMNKAANSKKADAATSPALDALDIAGYNYASGRYPKEGQLHPDRLIVGSETFPQDIAKNWAMVEQYPYLIGDFLWTAWDYLGEAGLGAWAYTKDGAGFQKPYPWLLADTGVFDILGDPNGEAFWAAAVWGKLSTPALAVRPLGRGKPTKMVWRGTNAIPSWSWQGCQGERATVEVYMGKPAVSVELKLGGISLGKKPLKDCRALFQVKYAPGTLEATVFDGSGKSLGSGHLLSAAGNLKLALHPEKGLAKPGEVLFVPVTVESVNGAVESNADRLVTVTVEGGELLGFGSANPRTEERFDTGSYTTYYGRALAVVRAGDRDKVKVTAGDGETFASVAIPLG